MILFSAPTPSTPLHLPFSYPTVLRVPARTVRTGERGFFTYAVRTAVRAYGCCREADPVHGPYPFYHPSGSGRWYSIKIDTITCYL